MKILSFKYNFKFSLQGNFEKNFQFSGLGKIRRQYPLNRTSRLIGFF